MKNCVKPLVVIFFLCSMLNKSYATHMAGADLTYQSLGNGQYLITYTFYRDCIGIDAQASLPLNINSFTCNYQSSATLLPVPGTGQLISHVCPGALTTCDGGTETGIQKWEYTTIIQLPAQCIDWTFGVSACCRNAAITTVDNADQYNMYLEANLNNLTSEDNSPVFSNVPIAFECINQDNYFNHGGLDIDGDSLVYSFYMPLDAPNNPVPYDVGYSLNFPLTSTPPLSINPVTGDIFMHPTAPEISIIAIRIEAYRNGVLIGAVIRDIQIYTITCTNQLPIASGINGTNSFNYNTCLNGPVCFDILTTDPDAADSLTVSWNHGIPAGTFTYDTTQQWPVIHFCWNATAADVRTQPYFFVVTVRDNACPTNGTQSFSYSIYLQSLSAVVSSTDISCHGGHNGSASIQVAGAGTFTYNWMPGMFNTQSVSHLTANTYTVDVQDNLGCMGSYSVVVNEPPPITLNVTGVNATCQGTPGSATALASGGTGSLDYLWATVPPSNTQTINGVDAGTYYIVVTDDNNCTASDSITLTGSSPFTASITSTPATCLANNGTATVTTSGGSGQFTYSWSPNVSNSDHATHLGAGVYNVTVSDDSSGCIQNLTTMVQGSTTNNANITSYTDATCESGEDGSATVMGSNGTPPYSYLWMPGGQNTPTATGLAPGVYSVMVADYNGCPDYAMVTIGFLHPAPVLELGVDTIMCIGDVIVLDAGAGFSYAWTDASTNQTLSVNSSGNYGVMVTDANGCEAFDNINVTYVTCFRTQQHSGTNYTFTSVVRPNPAGQSTEIYLARLKKGNVEIRMRDAMGTLVHESRSEAEGYYSKEIPLDNLPSGIYYLEIITNQGTKTERVVKM